MTLEAFLSILLPALLGKLGIDDRAGGESATTVVFGACQLPECLLQDKEKGASSATPKKRRLEQRVAVVCGLRHIDQPSIIPVCSRQMIMIIEAGKLVARTGEAWWSHADWLSHPTLFGTLAST